MVCMESLVDGQGWGTCCSGILSFRADLRSLAVLSPRVALSRHVLSEVPERALRPRKSDKPLILAILLTAKVRYALNINGDANTAAL